MLNTLYIKNIRMLYNQLNVDVIFLRKIRKLSLTFDTTEVAVKLH